MSNVNEEGVAAVLGLVLLTFENSEVRIPKARVEAGLPENSGIQVFHDEEAEELVIRIAKVEE